VKREYNLNSIRVATPPSKTGRLKMHYHTELKKDFEHLQGRTLELLRIGMKRECKLEEKLAVVWNELRRILELDSLDDIKNRLVNLENYMGGDHGRGAFYSRSECKKKC
jgi:hypothetical protein